MSRYAEVIEQADGNLSAYVPDLPGCVNARRHPRRGPGQHGRGQLVAHESLRAHGEAVPPPSSTTALVEVAL